MKRGQVQQVFIYIMTVVVIGFILLIGVRSYLKIQKTSCDAERVTFMRELNKVLAENTAWGRESIERVRRPCEFEVVCFVDDRSIKGTVPITGFTPAFTYPTGALILSIVDNSVRAGVEKNIFIANREMVEPIGYDEMIILQDPRFPTTPDFVFCIQSSSGYFSFNLSGKGNAVLVEPP